MNKQSVGSVSSSSALAPAAVAPAPDASRVEFDATRAEREAIGTPDRVTLDLVSAHITAASALPGLLALEAELAKMGIFDTSLLRKVEDYGRAMLYASAVERATNDETAAQHPALVQELEVAYQRLYRVGELLAAESLFDPKVLAGARSGTSVRDRASDLSVLAVEYRANEATLAGKMPLTRDDIARAAYVSRAVIDSLVDRAGSSEARAAATRDRQLAATLFARTWNEIRRAITWLRWNDGDADTLAPSLYANGNGSGRRAARDDSSERPADPSPPANPLPADKRDELERAGTAARPLVPQDDPFIR
jgi:hypothetical protein